MERGVREHGSVSVQDLLEYYHSHVEQFQSSDAVRWEQVTVPEGALPEKQAVELIDYLRRQLLGDPFVKPPAASLAAAESQVHGWTRPDQVTSETLKQAVFSVPIGNVSPVIRDAGGWHLVRVLQRRVERQMPFEEVAESIGQEIFMQRRSELERAYLEQLRRQAAIWTVFDPPVR
jgi:hypothetical protein